MKAGFPLTKLPKDRVRKEMLSTSQRGSGTPSKMMPHEIDPGLGKVPLHFDHLILMHLKDGSTGPSAKEGLYLYT
ncbi:hypothetical protein Taro_032826 [Colocasia esculenta]|uniref:Uncharacterized protein n=1 Tax=Colocasia esculenta TaxID=4460 RepID=A0A843VMA5_COLES|nr:hypothetical protein [Colocasia esculenta]